MEKKSTSPSGLTGRQLVASIFIACGIMLLGRNLGFIPNDLFRIVVSWPMLLIVLGAYSILRRQMFTGLILFVVGLCFIMPRLGVVALDARQCGCSALACCIGMPGHFFFLSSQSS